jgi:hypothetical protein
MTGFSEALQKGLEAHKHWDEARKEANEVLVAASKEASAHLGEEITFQFEEVDRPVREPSLTETVAGIPAPRKKYTALTVRLRRSKMEVLAEVRFAEHGYPLTIRWESDFRMAPERGAFEAVIQDLLARGATGAKIASLLQRP